MSVSTERLRARVRWLSENRAIWSRPELEIAQAMKQAGLYGRKVQASTVCPYSLIERIQRGLYRDLGTSPTTPTPSQSS